MGQGSHQEALSYDIQPGKDGKPVLCGVQGIGNQWGFGFSQLQTPDQIGKRFLMSAYLTRK